MGFELQRCIAGGGNNFKSGRKVLGRGDGDGDDGDGDGDDDGDGNKNDDNSCNFDDNICMVSNVVAVFSLLAWMLFFAPKMR